MNILVPVDGSDYTKRMLAYLTAHDEWLGGLHRYTLLHVVGAMPSRVASAVDKATLQAYYDSEAEKVLKPIRAFFARHADIQAEFMTKTGSPVQTIVKLAQLKKYDLVMMGSHGHAALGNLILGSVATKVLAQTSVPVLLIR